MRSARVCVLVMVALGVLLAPAPARPAPGLMVGASEDMFKLEPDRSAGLARDLGLRAARVTLHWNAGQTSLSGTDAAQLQIAASTGVRLVVAVYGWRDTAPQDTAAREAYCAYARDLITRVPAIRDVVIWNEPNLSFFWRPQFDAAGDSAVPAAYMTLLARCWDVLHAARPDVNVIAPATSPWGSDDPADSVVISHSPGAFLHKLGDAYRASGRTLPLFDTVGHHVYGASPGERPWRRHLGRRISQGDVGKLVTALQESFGGTAQPVPGVPVGGRSAPIWYMEAGFETAPDGHMAWLYTGSETTAALPDSLGGLPWTVLPDPESASPDQATQLRDALRLAYCQPYVEAFFNFLLRDQEELPYWQSGVLWPDRTPKDSYAVFRQTITEVTSGAVDCSRFAEAPGQAAPPATAEDVPLTSVPGFVPAPPATELTVETPPPLRVKVVRWLRGAYGKRHTRWRLGVRTSRAAVVRAELFAGPRRIGVVRVRVQPGTTRTVVLRKRPLPRGRYRIVLRARAVDAPNEQFSLRGPVFRVRAGR